MKIIFIKLLLFWMSLCLTSALSVAQVQPSFFGMHVNKLRSMPVDAPIGSMRLWDTQTNWFQLCPSSDFSQCEWRHLDDWLSAAKSNGVSEVAYTFGKTPDWASSDPQGDCWKARPGACYPPRDLNPDGSGTNQAFRSFVTALVEHNQRLDSATHAKIRYWGICNEPTVKYFWRGTTAQLVRMAKDAWEIIKKADPQALILTPEPAANARQKATDAAVEFLDEYLAKGGDKYADVVAFHVYANAVGDHPVPEDIVRIVQRIKGELARHSGVAGKPLWITECSWGQSGDTNWKRDDDASAFLVRYLVLAAAQGIQRTYWYGWDVPTGTLSIEGQPLPAARAYKEVHDWILGKSVTNCQAKSHVWSCDLSGSAYRGRIVWNDEYQRTSSYDTSEFAEYRSFKGERGTTDKKARMMEIGNGPTLLESGRSDSTRRTGTGDPKQPESR